MIRFTLVRRWNYCSCVCVSPHNGIAIAPTIFAIYFWGSRARCAVCNAMEIKQKFISLFRLFAQFHLPRKMVFAFFIISQEFLLNFAFFLFLSLSVVWPCAWFNVFFLSFSLFRIHFFCRSFFYNEFNMHADCMHWVFVHDVHEGTTTKLERYN